MQHIFLLLKMEFKSLYRLAKLLGITPNAVYQWRYRETIPLHYVKAIEKLSEGRIDRKMLRPEIFGE